MAPVHVHTLRFDTPDQLSWAFSFLLGEESVDDCLVEPDLLRIRFVARPDYVDRLLDRVYQRGGLVWCERSRLRA